MKPLLFTLSLAALLNLFSCGGSDTPSQSGKPTVEPADHAGPLIVYTTFYPTCFFSTVIGGSHVKAINPVPPDEDAIFWVPPDDLIERYWNEADLMVLNGAGFAKWVKKTMLPEDKLVNAGEEFEDDLIKIVDAVTHSHGQAGEHAHAGIDPHTWLDPHVAMGQCKRIARAFIEKDPDNKADYEKNLAALVKRMEGLDTRLKKLTEGYDGTTILASHPAYNYLARQYGWNVKSFDFDPEKLPGPASLLELKSFLAENVSCRHLLWESEPTAEVKAVFSEEFALEQVVFSPVEAAPAEGLDYVSMMGKNIDRIAVVFE